MKRVMLIYPPGMMYQRGEDRCQINVEASIANSMRACNDLGYAAAILKNGGYNIFLRDYTSEKESFETLKTDIIRENPDVIFISITNGTIYDDIKITEKIKSVNPNIKIILKGALFFNPEKFLFDELNLEAVDILIGGETEFIILPLLNALFDSPEKLKDIEGICYKVNNNWEINNITHFEENLDGLPFPDRSSMRNELYINPATNKPMATIATSRGCPSSCIYCVSPLISGRKVRFRSPQNVFEEIKECVEKYNIADFFFKSDTFTIDKKWVIELCDFIINSDLKNKINWVANSRVNTIDEDILQKMKEAGCSLIALGIESGSDDSLLKMKKGTTVEQNIKAVNIIKKYDIKIFGFYLIGFPWETKEHLEDTKKLMFRLDTDFVELSVATPFKGSKLYEMIYGHNEDGERVLGKDSFKYTTSGTKYLSAEYLRKFRKNTLLLYHLRPGFIIKKLISKDLTFGILCNYIKYGFKMIKNTIF